MEIQYKKVLTRGIYSALEDTPVEDGKLRFTTDTGDLYLDNGDGDKGDRVKITDIVTGKKEEELNSELAPLPKVYLTSDTHKLMVRGEDQKWYANASTADNATNDKNGKEIDTTYAPLESPTFTGTPTTPDITVDTGEETTGNEGQITNVKYVKESIKNAIAGVTQFDYEIVEQLPESGVKGKFYLMQAKDSKDNGENSVYEEYLWITDKWELVGTTRVDLTPYATTEAMTTELAKKANTNHTHKMEDINSGDYDFGELDETVTSPVTST